MEQKLTRKSIFRKAIQVGSSTVLSKALALLREVLAIKFMGAGAISDAFWVAFEIPNLLRKAFAEGALSAALTPTFSVLARQKKDDQISKLLTLVLIIIEGFLLAICLYVFFNASYVISLVAPGFVNNPEQFQTAAYLLRILIFFILFISTSALLAGAQQAKDHFLIPSLGPVILNIVFISGLALSLYFNFSIYTFALIVLLGAGFQLFINIYKYCQLGFSFCLPSVEKKSYCINLKSRSCKINLAVPDSQTRSYFSHVFLKFLPCVIAMSAIDINLLIDKMFASYLPAGTISLLKYSSGFLRIPIGVIGVALSTVLLSHLSRVSVYAPKRLSYYLLDSAKLIIWLSIPIAFFMSFVSYKIFYTIFLSSKFTLDHVVQASGILIALLAALPCFCLNKIILSMYYSQHSTLIPTFLTIFSSLVNLVVNMLLVPHIGVLGLAISTSLSAIVQTILYIAVLHKFFGFKLYISYFREFLLRFTLQFTAILFLFLASYYFIEYLINNYLSNYAYFLLDSMGYWLWSGPLILIMFGILYITRKYFGINIYYLS